MSGKQVVKTIGSQTFTLKTEHDFSWLPPLGDVFAVFDQQDSGNISFGVQTETGKRFVKYAGAQTIYYDGGPKEAIDRLKSSVTTYKDLVHPALVHLRKPLETAHGFALVFDWAEGECLHSHWSFPPPAKHTHPDSPFYRFKQLSLSKRLASFTSIYDFHRLVEQKGYAAIDFYDGSILYDFQTDSTTICDIDVYHKKPYINEMGRMWGSTRFMSPEEFVKGAVIDERTNVYRMGAMAFALIGGEEDRNINKWDANGAQYQVALKAVADDKNERFPTISAFIEAWEKAST